MEYRLQTYVQTEIVTLETTSATLKLEGQQKVVGTQKEQLRKKTRHRGRVGHSDRSHTRGIITAIRKIKEIILPSANDTIVNDVINLIQVTAGLFVETAISGIVLSGSVMRIKSLRLALSFRGILRGRATHTKEMIDSEILQ
jgi:hypothetical protein